MALKCTFRGIFSFEDEENNEWKEALIKYNGIPKFLTKEECIDFIKKYCTRGSNPKYPNLQHIFSLLVDWEQIVNILIPKIEKYNKEYPYEKPLKEINSSNRFLQPEIYPIIQGIDNRMSLPFHQMMNSESTLNTLSYLFNHMRCGIYVMIRKSKIQLFVPFVNKNYENNWGHLIKFDSMNKTKESYYIEKKDYYRKENIISDINKWWANGNIICNEHCRPPLREEQTQFWGDQFLAQLRDMLEESCKYRYIPDCDFFINKRDYPHLKANLSEPYGFLFDKDDKNDKESIPLTREKYGNYMPIMSFYVSKTFADIPFPCSEDWDAATGLVFPISFSHTHCKSCRCGNRDNCQYNWKCFCPEGKGRWCGVETPRDLFTKDNFVKFERKWEDKVGTAFFRGNATGGGTTIETNQRIHLAYLSHLWDEDPRYRGYKYSGEKTYNAETNDTDEKKQLAYLDAELTGWNVRDKKLAGFPMTFTRKNTKISDGVAIKKHILDNLTAGKHHYIPIFEQSLYKYIIYVEGHCAANRYAFLMRLGCVILRVESKCVADEMWYFPLLKPYEDHIPVKKDLSDLAEKIEWCRKNDEKCKMIATKAKTLYEKFISKEAIYDYVELITHKIANSIYTLPKNLMICLPEKCTVPTEKPNLNTNNYGSNTNQYTYCTKHGNQYCVGCREEMNESKGRDLRDDNNFSRNTNMKYDHYNRAGSHQNYYKRHKSNYHNINSQNYYSSDSYGKSFQKKDRKQCRLCRRHENKCTCRK